jgi:hypothetical protein
VQRYYWRSETCIGPCDEQIDELVTTDEQRIFKALRMNGNPDICHIRESQILK